LSANCLVTQKNKAKYDSGALWRMKRKCHVHVNFTLIQVNFGLKTLNSYRIDIHSPGGATIVFVHFRCISSFMSF